MSTFLLFGALIGGVIGVFEARRMYRRRIVEGGVPPLIAAYYAAWTFGLWVLFGAYLLLFWLIGAVGMAISALARRRAQ